MANTFKFGNGQWAVGKETALAYNDENSNFKPLPFSFDRGSIATVVNKNGLIETVGVDEPRIDFLNNTKGHLLLEPSRQNKVPYSQDFTSSLWSAQSGATKQHNVAISPDGTQNASRFNFDGTSNGRVEYNNISGLTVGVSYTISVYLKSESGNIENVQIGDAGWGLKTVTVTNKWQRYTQTITSNGSIAYPRVRLDAVGSVLVWGYQLEAGSYATSYIPTSGQSGGVTRSAETAVDSGNTNVINSTEGTLYVEANFLEGYDNNNFLATIFDNSNGANNNVFIQRYLGNIQAKITVGGTTQAEITQSGTTSGNKKIAFTYKSNEFKLFVNGSQVGSTATSGSVFTANTLDKINVGSYYNDTLPFNNAIKDLRVYNTALSDSELQALTS
jgi:hypothetical protein